MIFIVGKRYIYTPTSEIYIYNGYKYGMAIFSNSKYRGDGVFVDHKNDQLFRVFSLYDQKRDGLFVEYKNIIEVFNDKIL